MPTQTFFNLDNEKRELILTHAMEEFSERSFNEASVNTIVRNVGISKGSLYQYFDDKVDLYLYILEIAGQKKFQFLETCDSCFEGDDFFELLTELMVRGCEFDLNNPIHSKLLHQALTGPLVGKSMENMLKMNRQYMEQLLRKGVIKHQVRKDVDFDMLVFFLTTITNEFAKYVASKTDLAHVGDLYHPQQLSTVKELDLPAMIKELMKLIKNGLASEKKNEVSTGERGA